MSIIIVIVAIVLIVILLICLGKKYFKGGATTYLSDSLVGVDYITDLFKNLDLFAKEYKELHEAKRLNPDLVPKKFLYRNIAELLKFIDNKYDEITEKNSLNYNTVLSGVVEACIYIASYSHGLDNFSYNKIECERVALGGFNMVFICKITPYDVDGENLEYGEKYALRVLYNANVDSLEYTYALKKLMKEPNYEKYFMKPIIGHVDFNSFNTSEDSIKTSWNLFKLCKTIRNIKPLKYLETEFNCLDMLHKHELCYKDWKFENMMEFDTRYILTDIDFSFDNAPYSIRHKMINKFLVEQGYTDIFKLNYALDNVIALISWLQITNSMMTGEDTYDYYDYYDEHINQNMKNFLLSCHDIDNSKLFYKQILNYYLPENGINIKKCFI